MSWLSDIFGGGSGGGDASSTFGSIPSPDMTSLPQSQSFSQNPMSSPGSNAFSNFDFSNLPSLTQSFDNPAGTPGFGGGGFDLSNSFGFTPSSFTQNSENPSGTPGLITQPNNLGGAAALPGINTGAAPSPVNPTSAMSNSVQLPGGAGNNPAGAPPAGGNSSSGDILSMLGLGTGNTGLDSKLFGAGVSGAGLLANLFMGSPSASAEKQLKNIAGQQNSQGQALESYLQNGTLPPGAQQWVDQQTQAQKAAIRAKHAQEGTAGSSMEVQELNQVDQAATAQMFTIASELLNAGISETNASGTLYNYLMQAQNADAKDVSQAIQNFVTSLAGGGGSGQNLTLSLAH